MAFQIAPPKNFNFSSPDEWPSWIKRSFERYRQASGLSDKAETSQVNALVYAMGYQAEDILTSFRLSEGDAKKYGIVKDKFEGHFVKNDETKYTNEQDLTKESNYRESQRMNLSPHSIVS